MPRTWLEWLCAIAVLSVAAVTAARYFAFEVGPFAWLIAFTPYIGLAAVVLCVVGFATRVLPIALLATGCAVLQLSWLVPLFVSDSDVPEYGKTLTVMTSNILFGRGDPAAIVDLVRDHNVDLLSVQELTPEAAVGLRDAGLNEVLEYRWLDASQAGMGIWSRYPLADLPAGSQVRWPAIGRHVDIPDLPLSFIAVHPAAPLTPDHAKWTHDQPLLRAALHSVPGAVVVAGDFNATLDHGIMRSLQADGFTDAAEAVGAGLNATWPQESRSPIPLFAIDHVMHRDVTLWPLTTQTAVVPGSDHRAVIATYRWV
ncbi:MAG: endonuclease/exonuclease/phosphatase family protein [Candidatus Nanopelagicales bacterium]